MISTTSTGNCFDLFIDNDISNHGYLTAEPVPVALSARVS
jgi:hypothetical protein